MKKQEKSTDKFYVTTPIYYVNDRPHIGHAYSSILADVFARFHRARGESVFFLTGTDEHGRKIAEAAEKAGLAPQSFADEYSSYFKSLLTTLNISNDAFLRTTDRATHWPVVAELWRALKKRGDIYKGTYEGLYCVGHEAFLKPSELKEGVCPDHKTAPERIKEENYFFRLSKYAKEIELRIRNNELQIIPETRKNEVLGFIKEGLEDISFSRPRKDLAWGIPVPDDDTQTIYVWMDALTNYISGLGAKRDAFFPPDLQILGKDILRFHAVIWPAVLLSLGLPLPKTLLVHGHITIEGEKMSKTLRNVVDPVALVKRYGIDPVRYYLLREIRSSEDGDFSIEKLEKRYDGDLANGLSNLIHRVATLAWNNKHLLSLPSLEAPNPLSHPKEYNDAFEECNPNEALEFIWGKIGTADKKINDAKLWTLPKEDVKRFASLTEELLKELRAIASLIAPLLPETSEKIISTLSFKEKPEPIFKRSEK